MLSMFYDERLFNREVKQVIVLRKDLNMRKGKMVAQGAHASLAVFLSPNERNGLLSGMIDTYDNTMWQVTLNRNSPGYKWLTGSFTKIVLSIESEAKLLALYTKVRIANLPCSLITDKGLTEFNDIPTNTCIAIGPWWSSEIDIFTRKLSLL